MSEDQLRELEKQFPTLSGEAFGAARDRVLASGQSILVSDNGIIYERFPDGRRVAIEKINPPRKVIKGTILKITQK